jgi:tetraacyldisaccharide 4'-kinase
VKAPAFFDRPIGPTALALAPIGALYGLVTAARMRLVKAPRAPAPVICVGNFTLGGAGKTPAVIAILERLTARGERPFALSRGYGGTVAGPHRVDIGRDTARTVGDEPMLIAAHAGVIVGADRAASAELAVRAGASVLVMDDGLQNPGLAKDLSIAVVDAASGVGNGLPFPAGPLRAPVGLQLGAVDAVVLVGTGVKGERVAARAEAAGRPVLRARLAPTEGAQALAGQRVFAFCGIGRPDKFRRTLEELGVTVAGFRAFPDHHPYDGGDANALMQAALAAGLPLVTTRKDHVRLLADPGTRGLLAGLVNVVDVELRFEDEDALKGLLDRARSQ